MILNLLWILKKRGQQQLYNELYKRTSTFIHRIRTSTTDLTWSHIAHWQDITNKSCKSFCRLNCFFVVISSVRFRLFCTGLVFNLDAGRVALLHSPAVCSLSRRNRAFTVHRTFTAHSTQHTAVLCLPSLLLSTWTEQTLYRHCLRNIEFYEVRI